ADLKAVPARTFSYFDPEAKRYVTLSAEPIALAIAPGARGEGRAMAPGGGAIGSAASSGEHGADEEAGGFELAPNQIALRELSKPGAALARRRGFLAGQLLPIAAAVLAIGWIRRRDRLERDPRHVRRRAAHRAIDEQVQAMRRAAGAADATGFFAAAR